MIIAQRTTVKDSALRKLTGLTKKKAKNNTALNAFPFNTKSYLGFDTLSENIRTGIINLNGGEIQYHERSLRILLGQGYWIQIHCLLHEHVLLISAEELNDYWASWRTICALHSTFRWSLSIKTQPYHLLFSVTAISCWLLHFYTALRYQTLSHCSMILNWGLVYSKSQQYGERLKAWKPRENTTTIFCRC